MAQSTPLHIAVLFAVLSLLVGATPARAVTFLWDGTVVLVEEDTGAGLFTGAGVGAGFEGFFSYGDTCGTGCSPFFETGEADYAFEGPGFGALLQQGTTSRGGSTVFINVQNDLPLTADEAVVVSLLTGSSVSAGTLVDVWTAGSESDGTIFSGEELFDGGTVEVVFLSLDTTLFDDTSYRPLPPAIGDVDLAGFIVQEAMAGTLVYSVFGTLGSAEVPEPGAAWLLAGVGLLALARRRRA